MTMLEGAVSAVVVAGAVVGAGEAAGAGAVAVPVLLVLVLVGAEAEAGEEALLLPPPLLVLLLPVRWQIGKTFCVVCLSTGLVHFLFDMDVFFVAFVRPFRIDDNDDDDEEEDDDDDEDLEEVDEDALGDYVLGGGSDDGEDGVPTAPTKARGKSVSVRSQRNVLPVLL
jgi:hypothetical protein